jgi:hypothetical protein
MQCKCFIKNKNSIIMYMKFVKIIGGIIVLFIIRFIVVLILDEFDMSVSQYGSYLNWITALIIFALVLPKKTGKYFE